MQLQQSLTSLQSIDFSALEIREIGSWPLILRIVLTICASLVTMILIMYFLIFPEYDDLADARKKQDDKRAEFMQKYDMAINLSAYKQQMVEMQGTYKDLLKQLPSSSNIPELIENISQLGEIDNLKFTSIKIGEPTDTSGFYKQLSITLSVVGTYHDFGKFISDMSKLPRIVTLGDFTIKPSPVTKDNPDSVGLLILNIEARTYWISNEPVPAAGGATPATGPQTGKAPAVGKGVKNLPIHPGKVPVPPSGGD